jgi:hypothetical protein
MRFKHSFLLLVFTFLSALTVSAQSNCAITLDHIPAAAELHGFQLGMTMEQVKARVPPIVFGRVDHFGGSKTSINPAFDPRFDKASFDGVRTISLTFLDGRLIELWIGYDASFKWQKLDDFVAGISKALNLPATWQPKGRGEQISCNGLQISAAMLAGSPSLRLADTTAEQTLTSRMEAAANAEEETETDSSIVIGDKHSKLFYSSGCPGVDEVSVANRVVFKDIEEAQKAGYKLAKTCH